MEVPSDYSYDKNLACNLRYLRLKHHLSRKQLSELSGVSIYRLRKIEENDKSARIYLEYVEALAVVFQVEFQELFLTRLEDAEDGEQQSPTP